MNHHTFAAGDKARDTETGELYTVVAPVDEYGFVAFTRDVPKAEYISQRFIEPVESDTPEHSEDELHALLIEWGASEKTTVNRLLRWAIDADIDVKALFNAYTSLIIENGGK